MEEIGSSQPVSFSLKYSVRRSEVTDWYWSAWRRPDGLWQYWLLCASYALIIATSVTYFAGANWLTSAKIAFLFYLAGISFFVVFPQWKYKPSERTLIVDANGITTTRGTESAQRSWKDISAIRFRPGYMALVIAGGNWVWPGTWLRTRNGNAFIIPDRAFANDVEKVKFRESVEAWHVKSALRFPRFANSRYYAAT